MGNFHEQIHRGGFLTTFNPADKNCRKVCLFRQFFLAEAGFLASGANGFAQMAAMLLAGLHNQLRKQVLKNIAMSLTTNFFLRSIYGFGKKAVID